MPTNAKKDNDSEDLSEVCQMVVNVLTDLFIQYTQRVNFSGDNFELFSLLWLNFMKVLLQYSEQCSHLSESNMGQSVHDNV